MTRRSRRKNPAKRCGCCDPGRFMDVTESLSGRKYYHSDDGSPAEFEGAE
jgi:hypothetical protein